MLADDSPQLATLVSRITRGDQPALAELFDRTAAKVKGLARLILGDADRADEVTLDVFVQVWRSADRFDPARGSVWSWLTLIARSRAIDELRRSRLRICRDAHQLIEELDPGSTPDADEIDAETTRRVRVALARLPESLLEVIVPAFYGGLSYRQTAQRLGLPEGTVKSRIRAALATLRRELFAATTEENHGSGS